MEFVGIMYARGIFLDQMEYWKRIDIVGDSKRNTDTVLAMNITLRYRTESSN